jgi:hypothetical protein
MGSPHHHIRHRLDRRARRVAGVVGIVLVLATSSWAQTTPGNDQQTGQPPRQQEPDQSPVNEQPEPAVPADGRMLYSGFRIDGAQILNSPQYAAIMASMPRQIDIVKASGVRPEVLRFFQSQIIVLRYGLRSDGGRFDPHNPGVSIADVVADPQKPIVLHELLHAFHCYVIQAATEIPIFSPSTVAPSSTGSILTTPMC